MRRSDASRIELRLVSEFTQVSENRRRTQPRSSAKISAKPDSSTLIVLGDGNKMETATPIASSFMLDIHRQLAARNAVEVHAFREITTDYQRCLGQLRELRVRA